MKKLKQSVVSDASKDAKLIENHVKSPMFLPSGHMQKQH